MPTRTLMHSEASERTSPDTRPLRLQALLDLMTVAGRGQPAAEFFPELVRLLSRLGGGAFLGAFSRLDPEAIRLHLAEPVATGLAPERLALLTQAVTQRLEALATTPAAHRVAPYVEFPLSVNGLPACRIHCHVVFDEPAPEARASRSGVLGGILAWSGEGTPRDELAEGRFAPVAGLLRLYLLRAADSLALESYNDCLGLLNGIYNRTIEHRGGLDFTFSRLREIFGYDMAAVALPEAGRGWRVLHRVTPDLPESFIDGAQEILREAMDREDPRRAASVRIERHEVNEGRARVPATVESMIVLRLAFRSGQTPGVLGLFSGQRDLFTPQQVRLLGLLSPGLAVSIRNSELLSRLASENAGLSAEIRETDRQLDLAREVQSHLLPASAPQPEGLSVAAFSRPVASVGGDLYDFRLLEGGALGVLLADVSGKGLAAAMLSSLTKGLLRGLEGGRQRRTAPATLLARLNDALAAELMADRFVSAVYAVFDPAAGRTHVSGAGHEPALHYSARTGRVTELVTAGLPLGVFARQRYATRHRGCAPGDVILLYTDGLYPRGDPDGRAHLKDALRRLAPLHPDAPSLAAAIRLEVEGRVGTAHDDAAAVVARYS